MIILKAVAHRSKDLLDIVEIVKRHPNLDRARVERWVREFAGALEQPELWEDVAGLMRSGKSCSLYVVDCFLDSPLQQRSLT